MAHEIESMFFTGATPWHSLGTKLDNPPTGAEAIRAAGLDWNVRLESLFTANGNLAPSKAIVRDSDGKILSVVGPRNHPLQNVCAFNFFDPFLLAGEASLHTAGSLRGGSRIWILAKIHRDPSVIVPGDEIEKYILLSNCHDDKESTRVGFTPIRVVCANTLAMSHSSKASKLLRVRHTRGNVAALDDIRDAMNAANESFEATANVYRSLARRQVNTEDLQRFVKIVFPNATQKKISAPKHAPVVGAGSAVDSILDAGGFGGIGTATNDILAETERDMSSRAYESIADLFENGRGARIPGVRGTAWGAYNAVTEYVTHVRGRSAESRLNSQFSDGASINANALNAAIAMVSA